MTKNYPVLPVGVRRDLAKASTENAYLAVLAEHKELSCPVTSRHEGNVGRDVRAMAGLLGVGARVAETWAKAAYYHDIGKTLVPDAIVNKSGPLTDDEMATMRDHTLFGARVLSACPSPLARTAATLALYHHERWDGKGYHGLSGKQIPLSARVLSVCDVWDALTSPDRPYKGPIPPEEALGIMVDPSPAARVGQNAFDPYILKVFVEHKLELHKGEISPEKADVIRAGLDERLMSDRKVAEISYGSLEDYAKRLGQLDKGAPDAHNNSERRSLVVEALTDHRKFDLVKKSSSELLARLYLRDDFPEAGILLNLARSEKAREQAPATRFAAR